MANPDTLPADFFSQSSGSAPKAGNPDTLPADFFSKSSAPMPNATDGTTSSNPAIHAGSKVFVDANPELSKSFDTFANHLQAHEQDNPGFTSTLFHMLASPLTGLASVPGEIMDWAKRGFRNDPNAYAGQSSESPSGQFMGNAIMALMPSKEAAETPTKYAADARSAVPGQIVRTQIPIEPPTAAASGASSAGSIVPDLVGMVSPRAAHALSTANRVASIARKLQGPVKSTKPFEYVVQDRPAPAWQSLPEPPEVAPEAPAPLPEDLALPSGKQPGGIQKQTAPAVPPTRPQPVWKDLEQPLKAVLPDFEPATDVQLPSGRPIGSAAREASKQTESNAPGQESTIEPQGEAIQTDTELLDGIAQGFGRKSFAKLNPDEQANVRALAERIKQSVAPPETAVPEPESPVAPSPAPQASTTAETPSASVEQPSVEPAAKPTMEEMSAAFKPDEAVNQAAKQQSADEGDVAHADAQKAWVQKMAQRLYANGKGMKPEQAWQLAPYGDLDESGVPTHDPTGWPEVPGGIPGEKALDTIARNGGKDSMSPATKRSPTTIMRTMLELRRLWNEQHPTQAPVGHQAYKVGDPVMYQGAPHTVTAVDPETGMLSIQP